jgi:uncharacterized protein YdiU (UPF0061 family)
MMTETRADFTNSFRALCDAAEGSDVAIRTALGHGADGSDWLRRWRQRLARETAKPAVRVATMRRENPAVVPRNHRVESTLEAALTGDYKPLDNLLRVLTHPWEQHPDDMPYRLPPQPHEIVRQTFCGT